MRPSTEPMAIDQGLLLADFARTCKAAARVVSMYPGTHPAIATSLSRLVVSAGRLIGSGAVTLSVYRDALAIERRSPLRPDPSIGELAALLHERRIGRLTVQREADAEDWRALLLLLAKTSEDHIAEGGIRRAWANTGRSHFDILEIDYAEVLRERGGGEQVTWDRIIAHCLQRQSSELDDEAVAALLEALCDAARFGALFDRLQSTGDSDGASIAVRLAALMTLIGMALDAARKDGEVALTLATETIAASCSHLTPDLMLALLQHRHASNRDEANLAASVADRITDGTAAAFMVRAIVADPDGTERLALALDTLAPSTDRKGRIVQLAEAEARQSDLGAAPGFDDMWLEVARLVMSYSDAPFVSHQYGQQLSTVRTRASEIERVPNDPPERIRGWMATVSDAALAGLDLQLLVDLLRIEAKPPSWEAIAGIAASEVERRTQSGDLAAAQSLVEPLTHEASAAGRPALRASAATIVEGLATGPLARHVALHFRTVVDADADRLNRLCQRLGPGVVAPLADALAKEANPVASRRLAALVLSFGTVGRRSVEQLKNSPNPAVRRTAIALLRRSGGQEALLELASMLGDDDAAVQRESIHAMVEIGTVNAHSVLYRLLIEADVPREAALRELLNIRDERAAPFFNYVLTKSSPRGKLTGIHLTIVEALGTMKPRPESVGALQQVLLRGTWWTPFRTAALRRAAAAALARLGTADALAVLESASRTGGPSVRRIARAQLASVPRRENSAV